jgi:ribosomal protein L37AE/L43A
MDITSITAAYTGLKFGKDVFNTLIEGKVEQETRSKVIEALTKLGQAQDVLFELREELFKYQAENELLRKKIGTSENWQNRLALYELTKTAGGAMVYESKKDPKHFACPSCIEKQQIQILQDNRTLSGIFRCTGCEATFPVNASQKLTPQIPRNHNPYA